MNIVKVLGTILCVVRLSLKIFCLLHRWGFGCFFACKQSTPKAIIVPPPNYSTQINKVICNLFPYSTDIRVKTVKIWLAEFYKLTFMRKIRLPCPVFHKPMTFYSMDNLGAVEINVQMFFHLFILFFIFCFLLCSVVGFDLFFFTLSSTFPWNCITSNFSC